MIRQEIQNKLHFFLLVVIVFLLPLSNRITNLFIILLALNWATESRVIENIKALRNKRLNRLWIYFYFAFIISFFLSENKVEASHILERYASLIAFPILLSKPMNEKELKVIFFAFVTGVFVTLFSCTSIAIYRYLGDHQISHFFYHSFSMPLGIFAIYLSMYCVFSIHILFYYHSKKIIKNTFFVVLMISLLLLYCVLLSAKLMLFILILGLVIRSILDEHSYSRKVKLSIVALVAAGILGAVVLIPSINKRFSEELQSDMSVVKLQKYSYDTPFTGVSLRLVFWKLSKQILDENNAWLAGVGIGDFNDVMNVKFKEVGIYTGNPMLRDKDNPLLPDTGYLGYGPHNQYVQITLSMGIFVALFFIYLLMYSFKQVIKHKQYLGIQLMLIVVLFCFTETVFSIHSGIVFIMLFLMLICNSFPSSVEKVTRGKV